MIQPRALGHPQARGRWGWTPPKYEARRVFARDSLGAAGFIFVLRAVSAVTPRTLTPSRPSRLAHLCPDTRMAVSFRRKAKGRFQARNMTGRGHEHVLQS